MNFELYCTDSTRIHQAASSKTNDNEMQMVQPPDPVDSSSVSTIVTLMPYYSIIPQAHLPRTMEGQFTYTSPKPLERGDLTIVPFRHTERMGIVMEEVHPHTPSGVGVKKPPALSTLKAVKEKIGQAPLYFPALVSWLATYYVTSSAFIFKLMTPDPPKRRERLVFASETNDFGSLYHRLAASSDALASIKKRLVDRSSFLGTEEFTTSEKYITYIKIVETNFKSDQTTLLLTPTVQDVRILCRILPHQWKDKTIVLTSELYRTKLRYWSLWSRLLHEKRPVLVLGTRSAIFAPLPSLATIIIDRAESDDYKQYDQNPRYDARTVACMLSELTGCVVKLFSDGVVLLNYELGIRNCFELFLIHNS